MLTHAYHNLYANHSRYQAITSDHHVQQKM